MIRFRDKRFLVVAVVVGVLAGIGPALQASSVEPTNALRYE